MGKRSNFERNPRDYYPTPLKAVLPLIPHLVSGWSFFEPCAGDGRLVRHLESHGLRCEHKSDIEPQADDIIKADAMSVILPDNPMASIITNPPWDRDILHPMIERFVESNSTWLLIDADWMHTQKAAPIIKKHCTRIVSIGRVKWIEESKNTGMDNCCWHRFDKDKGNEYVRFYGR